MHAYKTKSPKAAHREGIKRKLQQFTDSGWLIMNGGQTGSSLAHKSNFAGHVIITTRTAENAFSAPWYYSEMELEPVAG